MAEIRAPTQTLHIRNREFWTKFFLLYESLPALWDSRSQLYKVRAAKVAGYDILVETLREIEPNADREDVLRKINIFRTNFRREISRINTSNKLGKQYKTTLWYFDLLSFLKTQENRRERKFTPDGDKCILPKRRLTGLGSSSFVVKKPRSETTKSEQEPSEYEDEDTTYGYEDENVIAPMESATNEQNATTDNIAKEKHFQREFQYFSADRKTEPKLEPHEIDDDFVDDIDDIMQVVDEEDVQTIQQESTAESENETGDWSENVEATTVTAMKEEEHIKQTEYEANIKTTTTARESTRIKKSTQVQTQQQSPPSTWRRRHAASETSEILAKSWAVQYEEMSDEQKIYARKAISDILFEGCMGNLGRATTQQQQQNEDMQQSAPFHENGVHVPGTAVMVNGRSLLKQQQLTQQYTEVGNEFEECYVFDDGRAVKFQDWAAKMK